MQTLADPVAAEKPYKYNLYFGSSIYTQASVSVSVTVSESVPEPLAFWTVD